jgi:membrane associated rhomboid family serine protease
MFVPLRDENPTRRLPALTILLIALNIGVFVSLALSRQGLNYHILRMGVIPYEITHFRSVADLPCVSPWLSLLTSMFLHGSLFHLLGNMLYLWIFGNNVEDFLGSFRFVFFYLISGLGASLTQVVFSPNSHVPMIGASGAIAGVLGGYLILFPGARVMTLVFLFFFIRVVAIPAALVLGLWFLLQVLNVGMGGGVAWFAHIGGFLIGIVLVSLQRRRLTRTRGASR